MSRRRFLDGNSSQEPAPTEAFVWVQGDGANPVQLTGLNTIVSNLKIKYEDGTIEDVTTQGHTHIFNNTELNKVQYILQPDTQIVALFKDCLAIKRFERGVLAGATNAFWAWNTFEGVQAEFDSEDIFEWNPKLNEFDGCFKNSNLSFLPKDSRGYLWDRKNSRGYSCFSGTPIASTSGSTIPYDWR